jgi:hypothetical protein
VLCIDKFHLSLQTLKLEYFSKTAILIHGKKMKYASLISSHNLASIIAFKCLFLTQSTAIMAGPISAGDNKGQGNRCQNKSLNFSTEA